MDHSSSYNYSKTTSSNVTPVERVMRRLRMLIVLLLLVNPMPRSWRSTTGHDTGFWCATTLPCGA